MTVNSGDRRATVPARFFFFYKCPKVQDLSAAPQQSSRAWY